MAWQKMVQVLTAMWLGATAIQAEEHLKNGDFSDGSTHWKRAGEIVFFNEAGQLVDKDAGGKPALELKLVPNRWTIAEQNFRPKKKTQMVDVSLRVRASADYERDPNAEYSDVKFRPGGIYCWTGIVYPKTDFFLRLSDQTNWYALADLKPGGDWQTLKAHLDDLNPAWRERVMYLNAGPGKGSIYVQLVSVDAP